MICSLDLPQTPHGHLTAFCYLLPFPINHNVGFIHIYSHASIPTKSFHSLSLLIRSSSVSAITTRSSAYNNSHGKATLHSLDKASMTITNSKGLNAEPWCILTLTSKPFLLPQTVHTTVFCTSIHRHDSRN